MKATIRLANKKDAGRILRMLNSAPELRGGKQGYTKEMVNEYISNKNFKIFIYESDKKIAGISLAQFWKKAKYVYLFDLIIKRKYREKGIATILMNHLELEAKKQKMNLVYGHVHKDNKKMQNLLSRIKYKRGKENVYYSKVLK